MLAVLHSDCASIFIRRNFLFCCTGCRLLQKNHTKIRNSLKNISVRKNPIFESTLTAPKAQAYADGQSTD